MDRASCAIALAQLVDLGLVKSPLRAGYSRRTMLRTAARVGISGAIAAPIISAVVPVAAAHASTPGGGGGGNGGTQPQPVTTQATINSGSSGGPGQYDESVQVSAGSGSSAALITDALGDPIAGTHWLTFGGITIGSFSFGFSPLVFTTHVHIPSGSTPGTLTVHFQSAGSSTVSLNGRQVFSGSHGPFTANLSPGENTLVFSVTSEPLGQATGLDFSLAYTYTTP